MPPLSQTKLKQFGEEMYEILTRLFPICRSITGDGVRQTLRILQERIPLKIIEVPSGTEVFDWTVPDEWNISDAYILDPDGNKIIDFKENNLHVVGYSEPVDKKLGLDELKPHLHSLPDLPDVIPYLTSYYKRRWGFCMRHKDLLQLKEGEYTVKIESSLKRGSLTLAEYILPGEQEDEALLSTYTCHPSLANDNISSVVIFAYLAGLLSKLKLRYTYRFLFIPETIGAITYLSLNKDHILSRTRAGLVGSHLGSSHCLRYKRSRMGNAEIDRVAEHVMSNSSQGYQVYDYTPRGSDERQYCSPGFNLPVGLLSRVDLDAEGPPNDFGQYHTSSDNLSLVSGKNLAESLNLTYNILNALEVNRTYINQVMFCEPQLSKRNLLSGLGGNRQATEEKRRMMWLLNCSDGKHDLLDIADKVPTTLSEMAETAQRLVEAGLIKPQ
ncbi:MAG: DUF4910 domain-containing protein [Nitrospinales bacterium]